MVRMYHLAEPSFLEEAVCLSIWQASCRRAAGQRYRHLPAPLGAERNADGDQGAAPTFVGPPRHGVMCQIQERRPGRPFHQGCWMACPSLLFPVLLLFSVKPIFRQSPNAAGLGWIRCLSTSFSFLCLFLSILQPLWVSFLVPFGLDFISCLFPHFLSSSLSFSSFSVSLL